MPGGFSLVISRGGSIAELDACARTLGISALYALQDGDYVSYIVGAPLIVNHAFINLFADGVPPLTPLVAKGSSGASADDS